MWKNVEKVEKFVTAGPATDQKIIQLMRFAYRIGYRNTFRMCNNDCSFIATVAELMPRKVTLI
jgi:hypothetical protein